MRIDAKMVARLRAETGAPMMDCKEALQEAQGDFEKAKELLRKKGKQVAERAASREVKEGKFFSYVHPPGKIAVLVEVVCETDFVAKNEEFNAFGKGVCFTITHYAPKFLNRDQVDPVVVAKEREIVLEQTLQTMNGKPQQVIDKAVEGRMEKFFAEKCLLDAQFVDPTGQGDAMSVEQRRHQLVGKIGENIQIRRFVRMEFGG